MENPGGANLSDIGTVDLAQTAETTSGVVPVVRGPVLADGPYRQVFRAHMQGGTSLGPSFLSDQPSICAEGEQKKQNCRSVLVHLNDCPGHSIELLEERLG